MTKRVLTREFCVLNFVYIHFNIYIFNNTLILISTSIFFLRKNANLSHSPQKFNFHLYKTRQTAYPMSLLFFLSATKKTLASQLRIPRRTMSFGNPDQYVKRTVIKSKVRETCMPVSSRHIPTPFLYNS